MDQREVRAAWEKFIERGALSTELRASVAASWQRSRNHQVTIDRAMAPLVANAELHRHRTKHASLRYAARCALENSKTFLSDANSIMILTDPTGLIIDTQGDARVIDAGRTGAAMAESRPVQIHGNEHFCTEVQRWTCAAVPVHDPGDGELLGVVDISGPANTFNPQSLALAVSVGHHVESVLAQSLKQDHEKLLCHFLAKRSLWVTEECIVLDRRGAVLHATERGLDTIFEGGPVRGMADQIEGTPAECELRSRQQRNLWYRRYHRAAHAAAHRGLRSRRSEIETSIRAPRGREFIATSDRCDATTSTPRETAYGHGLQLCRPRSIGSGHCSTG